MSKTQMDHEPDLNRLAAFAEGRLEPVERIELERHVANCRPCREVLALLAEAGPVAAHAPLWTRPALWLPVAASVAAVGVAVLLVTSVGRIPTPGGAAPPAIETAPPAPPETTPPPADPPAGSPRQPSPPEAAPPAAAPPASRPPAPPASTDDDLLRRRSGEREVNGKTFRLVAGEWIDTTYDPGALLPEIEIAGTEARRELLTRVPALGAFTGLGERVTVVHEGTVYRFAPR